jgi:hypothetical protein
MKRWLTCLLLLPAMAFGNTVKTTAFYTDSSLVLIDQLQIGATYKIHVISYSCYAQANIDIEISRDCDGFFANYKRASGGALLNPNTNVATTMRLSGQQLETIREFERNMFTGTPEGKTCRATTYYNVVLDKLVKTYRDTDCRINRFVAIKNAFESDPLNEPTAFNH